MTLKNIAALILRFFTLNWFIKGLSVMYPTFIAEITPPFSVSTFFYHAFPLIYFFLAFCSWKFAPQIAYFLTKDIDSKIEIPVFSKNDLYCFAFVLVGLFLLLENIGNALNWIHYFISSSIPTHNETHDSNVNLYEPAQCFISIGAGLICILFSNRLASILIKRDMGEE